MPESGHPKIQPCGIRFSYTKVAGQRTLGLTPAKVTGMLRAMQRRASWEGVIVSPDNKPGPEGRGQFPVLYLGWHPGSGYEAHCVELNSPGYFVATSPKLSAPEVYVELGGQGQELWPRELFVGAFARKRVRAHRRAHLGAE